jgi:thiol:disulfide interchange protein
MAEVLYNIQNLDHFKAILQRNPGVAFVKLGAAWCPPCQVIKPLVAAWFEHLPENAWAIDVDVDASPEFYAFMKRKRVVKGIPSILCYMAGNEHHVPDDIVVGSSAAEVNAFFKRCLKALSP